MQSIFITGAATGIGRACAERFLKAGWFVGAYDIDVSAVERWAQAAGSERACAGHLDVTDETQWIQCLADFQQAGPGQLDVLLNNAGILFDGPFESIEPARHRAIMDVNVNGALNGCHAAHGLLRSSGGRVINMASASALFGHPNLASYSASKFAIRGLTESLRIEWADAGIQVCDVMPLFVKTDMVARITQVPATRNLGVKLTSTDIADVVLTAATARRPNLHYVVGLQTRALKMLLRLSPDNIAARVTTLLSRER